jgi:hypothetical protein
MGGGITVASDIGRGSTFTIRVLAWMNEERSSDVSDVPLIPSKFAAV